MKPNHCFNKSTLVNLTKLVKIQATRCRMNSNEIWNNIGKQYANTNPLFNSLQGPRLCCRDIFFVFEFLHTSILNICGIFWTLVMYDQNILDAIHIVTRTQNDSKSHIESIYANVDVATLIIGKVGGIGGVVPLNRAHKKQIIRPGFIRHVTVSHHCCCPGQ